MQLRTQVRDLLIILAMRLLGLVRKFEIQVGALMNIGIPYRISNFLTEPNSLIARINQIPNLRPQLHPQMLSHQNTFNGTINQIPYLDLNFFHQAQQFHCQN